MKTILIASDPYISQSYEQGIEVALDLAEAGVEVEVVVTSDFERCYEGISPDSQILKKMSQLALFDIPVIIGCGDSSVLSTEGVMSF